MIFLTAFLFPLIFAFLWRCRGGFMGLPSGFVARLVYMAIPYGLWSYSVGGIVPGVLTFFGAYVAQLFSYAPFMGDTEDKHIGGMAGIGIARLVVILFPFFATHPATAYMTMFGATSGLAYYLGWTYMNNVDSGISFPGLTLFGKTIIQPGKFAVGGGEWGEVFVGGFYGLILAVITIGIELKWI